MSKVKSIAEELSDIAAGIFEMARVEAERGAVTGARMLALGIAAGAVLRARDELLKS